MTTIDQAVKTARRLRDEGDCLTRFEAADAFDALIAQAKAWELAATKLDGALATVKKELDALKTLVVKVHQARGRYHSQMAQAALYEAAGLPNVKPVSGEKS
jgi:hypothetical protein